MEKGRFTASCHGCGKVVLSVQAEVPVKTERNDLLYCLECYQALEEERDSLARATKNIIEEIAKCLVRIRTAVTDKNAKGSDHEMQVTVDAEKGIEPYDFERHESWTNPEILQRMRKELCDACDKQPVVIDICPQEGCDTLDILKNRLHGFLEE